MAEEKIDAYYFTIHAHGRDSFEEHVLVIEGNLICHGNWLVHIEEKIEGILYGLELANYPSNVIKTKIIDIDLKNSLDPMKDPIDVNQLMKYVNRS